jgi:hypothetical protein
MARVTAGPARHLAELDFEFGADAIHVGSVEDRLDTIVGQVIRHRGFVSCKTF